jgi:GntR family transcriptional regulator
MDVSGRRLGSVHAVETQVGTGGGAGSAAAPDPANAPPSPANAPPCPANAPQSSVPDRSALAGDPGAPSANDTAQVSGPAAQLAYTELADALRRGIYPEGSRLPGERDLATRLGVSRTTLRQALGRLAAEGQLTRASQRGWFVARRVVGEPPSILQSFSEMARARGLEPSSHILAQEVRPATFEEAERLRIAPSSRVLEVRRVRGMDGVPVCLDTSILVVARAEALVDADLEDCSLYEALADQCDVSVARSSYAVQADAADREAAELLHVDEGSPVLIGLEITYDAADVPVLTSRTTYRGDAYRFQADLYRPLS